MGEPAKKLEKIATPAPDAEKPIELEYYYLPYNLGVHTQHSLVVGGSVNDGCGTTGIVRRITLYPTGVAVAEVERGRMPGALESEQRTRSEYLVLTGGHGKVRL